MLATLHKKLLAVFEAFVTGFLSNPDVIGLFTAFFYEMQVSHFSSFQFYHLSQSCKLSYLTLIIFSELITTSCHIVVRL